MDHEDNIAYREALGFLAGLTIGAVIGTAVLVEGGAPTLDGLAIEIALPHRRLRNAFDPSGQVASWTARSIDVRGGMEPISLLFEHVDPVLVAWVDLE